MHLIQVVAFFNGKIDQLEHKPLSSQEVMDIVSQASKTWSKTRLRVRHCAVCHPVYSQCVISV